uniref:WH2 domain-containing protein n=1 Tax=Globodera pallida TaxID=36090 RepID=A0A183CRN4_GLOPA
MADQQQQQQDDLGPPPDPVMEVPPPKEIKVLESADDIQSRRTEASGGHLNAALLIEMSSGIKKIRKLPQGIV